MRGRAGRGEKVRAEMPFVSDNEIQAAGSIMLRRSGFCLSDERKIGNELAAPAKIASDLDAGIIGMLPLHRRHRMIKQRSCLMQMKLRFAAAGDGEVLQNFRLKCGSKALGLANAVFLSRLVKLVKRSDAELLIEFEYLIR